MYVHCYYYPRDHVLCLDEAMYTQVYLRRCSIYRSLSTTKLIVYYLVVVSIGANLWGCFSSSSGGACPLLVYTTYDSFLLLLVWMFDVGSASRWIKTRRCMHVAVCIACVLSTRYLVGIPSITIWKWKIIEDNRKLHLCDPAHFIKSKLIIISSRR